MVVPFLLADAAAGDVVVVTGLHRDARVAQHLGRHGIRRGATVTVVQRTTGGGRVVSVAGSRIALGPDVTNGLLVERSR